MRLYQLYNLIPYSGSKVREFELKFAEYVGANHAVAVNNATSGLHLSVLP